MGIKDQFDDKAQELARNAKDAMGSKEDETQERARQVREKGQGDPRRSEQDAQSGLDQDYEV
ncbi:hypothetical protein ACGFW5_03970 [Streptomyces sp. NPDC048416]|uniref:hypothetical protein n=1 Tax=Streptomyces sp. NPDC048416 TaxID=3365546 RepID=UPI0037237BB7